MKRLSAILVTVLICSFTLPPGASASSVAGGLTEVANAIGGDDYRGPVEINPPGFERAQAKVYFPNQYEQKAKWPLVVLLHGFTGTGTAEDLYFWLRFRVSSRGFILVTPEGTSTPKGTMLPKKDGTREDISGAQFWNATDFCCDFAKTGVDDVKYLTKLVDHLARSYRVDRSRVYLLGHSNGGFMANRLACEAGEKFAAIASLAGGSFKNLGQCRRPLAVPYLQIHARDDKTIAFGEDPLYAGGLSTVKQWLKKNGCSKQSSVVSQRSPLPLVWGPEVSMKRWSDCASSSDVQLWSIEPFQASWYSPHIPSLSWGFSEEVLDYFFAHQR